jgi:hypothetical protein
MENHTKKWLECIPSRHRALQEEPESAVLAETLLADIRDEYAQAKGNGNQYSD